MGLLNSRVRRRPLFWPWPSHLLVLQAAARSIALSSIVAGRVCSQESELQHKTYGAKSMAGRFTPHHIPLWSQNTDSSGIYLLDEACAWPEEQQYDQTCPFQDKASRRSCHVRSLQPAGHIYNKHQQTARNGQRVLLEPTTDSNRTDACVQINLKECGVSLSMYIYVNKLCVVFAV